MTPDLFLTNISIGNQSVSLSITMAVITGAVAASRGRSFWLWGLIGGLTTCIGLIVLLFMPDVADTSDEIEDTNREQRRLKERLKQEQLKNRDFQSSVLGRIDYHDQALGVDTRSIKTPLNVAEALPIKGEEPVWYYEDQGHRAGPVSPSSLQALRNSGAIAGTTLVWREGMSDWTPFDTLDQG
ncbi:MAG: GYF domain-containing protein [Planctomycetota bacterium]